MELGHPPARLAARLARTVRERRARRRKDVRDDLLPVVLARRRTAPAPIAHLHRVHPRRHRCRRASSLALHYIHRLRERNSGVAAHGDSVAQQGSEFRVAVAGLMMANKFLDDNTYTNATWASISLIPLPEININRMEREFLAGIGYALFVSERVYGDWLRLLKRLVNARYASSSSSSALRHRRHNHNHNQAGRPGDAQRRRPVRTARTLECVAAERSVEQRTEQCTEQRERIEQGEQQQRSRSVSPRTPGGGARARVSATSIRALGQSLFSWECTHQRQHSRLSSKSPLRTSSKKLPQTR
ncbi:hypothetical protein C8J57DRAFT_382812 [Mycena rebaudengoi]|nr:hypothetical protein C8J57DRAFT_382812 [Mycena rebaudengoi]